MNTNEKIKNRFRELVDDTGLSKTECAKAIGISYSTLAKLYNNDCRIRMSIACKIANFFNVSLDYLAGRSDDRTITK